MKWTMVKKSELEFLRKMAKEAREWAGTCEKDIRTLKAKDREKLKRIAMALGFRQEWVEISDDIMHGAAVWSDISGRRKISLTWDMVFDVLEP